MEVRESEVLAVGHANQRRGAVVWSCCVKSTKVTLCWRDLPRECLDHHGEL